MNKYESQIEKALSEYENNKPYKQYDIDWICNRISWGWKWKKISEQLKNNFCDRIIKIMEERIY